MLNYKKHSIVLVPTNRDTLLEKDLYIYSKSYLPYGKEKYEWCNQIRFSTGDEKIGDHDWYKIITAELYVLSDDEIRVGDWFLLKGENGDRVVMCTSRSGNETSVWFQESKLEAHVKYCKKIIATTDKTLTLLKSIGFNTIDEVQLPNLSFEFLRKHIAKSYYDDKPITEILVGYDCDHNLMPEKVIDVLNVNKDNEITTKVIKNEFTFNRDELIELITLAVGESHDWSRKNDDVHSIGIIEKRFLEQWFNVNL